MPDNPLSALQKHLRNYLDFTLETVQRQSNELSEHMFGMTPRDLVENILIGGDPTMGLATSGIEPSNPSLGVQAVAGMLVPGIPGGPIARAVGRRPRRLPGSDPSTEARMGRASNPDDLVQREISLGERAQMRGDPELISEAMLTPPGRGMGTLGQLGAGAAEVLSGGIASPVDEGRQFLLQALARQGLGFTVSTKSALEEAMERRQGGGGALQ